MKKTIKSAALLFAVVVLLSSCFSYRETVGTGAAGSTQVTKWNHYVLFGLAPVGVSDSKAMAGGATNYNVHTRHSFVNGLLAMITFNLYCPTTTTVTK